MEGQKARSTTHKRRKPGQESRTKFDKWLDTQAEKGVRLTFKFYSNPRSWETPVPGDENWGEKSTDEVAVAVVLVVDRYNLMLSFEGHQAWVSKENILSCC